MTHSYESWHQYRIGICILSVFSAAFHRLGVTCLTALMAARSIVTLSDISYVEYIWLFGITLIIVDLGLKIFWRLFKWNKTGHVWLDVRTRSKGTLFTQLNYWLFLSFSQGCTDVMAETRSSIVSYFCMIRHNASETLNCCVVMSFQNFLSYHSRTRLRYV